MPSTYLSLHYHVVFSTERLLPSLRDGITNRHGSGGISRFAGSTTG